MLHFVCKEIMLQPVVYVHFHLKYVELLCSTLPFSLKYVKLLCYTRPFYVYLRYKYVKLVCCTLLLHDFSLNACKTAMFHSVRFMYICSTSM